MKPIFAATFALAAAASAVGSASAQTVRSQVPSASAAVRTMPGPSYAPRTYAHPVSPYGSNQPFPPPQFWSELISKEFTREALDASHQTREVNLANKASIMIDRGDCAGAEAYLQAQGAPDMAARVPVTCSAKRHGLI